MTDIELKNILGNIDIYLLDQIVKGRYSQQDKILDAGCGTGRNMYWFYNNKFDIWAVDSEVEKIELVRELYAASHKQFLVSEIDRMPYSTGEFNHIICNAVLHFAMNEKHFVGMMGELVRVLKVNGSIFIRMASNIGIEDLIIAEGNGIYSLPDGSQRFLLTRELLKNIMIKFNLTFLEPLKTTNVHDVRSMTTVVLQKN
ncbi:class I SAM-dependent methyltransferase [Flavobacteriaceae bacterium KMM 6897]|nr:class I SAM-dependent methyltransferase [Flavobacteriaceae bacterium KMM 6897]MEB8345553.1 class I SAM-dependent methyltransferase [Flavobacteriaceae bacterium KMM 6898]